MKIRKLLILFLLLFVSLSVCLPLLMIFNGSFMGLGEITDNIGPILSGSNETARWPFIPKYPTLRPYIEILLDTPEFFVMFWNSCTQVFPSLLGQFLVATPAAWAFSRFEFRYKKILFTLYIVLMILPFQVTMVSSYIVLDKLSLMDSHFALILPNIFSTFPVFIMTKFFSSIPKTIIEAAKLDGADELNIFVRIGIPMGAAGIISSLVLGFLEYWNGIEQPLIFLKNQRLWPLSLYLPNIDIDKVGISLAASVIMMLPALFIFLLGQEYLEQGIVASGLKE